MRRLPPLNPLRAFEAAARLSSVSAAAEELCVSHSAVSQQIRQLEHYFGQRLFSRPGRRVEPTPAALAYLEDVRAALDRISISSERFREGRLHRFLSLNATPSFALRWLIPKTAEFQIANPSIQLRMSTSTTDSIDQLDAPYDFIFRRDAMVREAYSCRRILDDVAMPVISPTLAARQPIQSPADLLNCTLLHARLRPNAWKQWFEVAGLPMPETTGGSFLDNIYLSIEAAITGVGAAIAPLVLVEDDLRSGRLIAPFPEISLEGPGFHVLYRDEAARERGGRAFLRWLQLATGVEIPIPEE